MVKTKQQQPASPIDTAVTDNISAMLAYWDKTLVCRFANTAYQKWFGKTREEMISGVTMPMLLGPTLFELNQPYINGVLNGQPQTFERTITLPNGETGYSLANYFPHLENGEVLGFFVHVADITSIKLLEIELTNSNQLVGEQNKRLLNFANIVSHNFKSHAANLEAVVEMLDNATSEEERKEMTGYLKKISTGFSQTVLNLSEIAKAQNLSLAKPQDIDLQAYVNKAVEMLTVQIKSTQATIHNFVKPGTTIYANPAYTESILLNLLTNAIKYKHPNRQPVIEVNATIFEKELRLTIRDNGLGIDMAKHGKRLFGLYQTFHENADANGVGLYIVKFQVESMGGRIDVESEVGNGTTFSIFLRMT